MEKVFSCRNKNLQDMRDALLSDFKFLGYKVVDQWTMNLFKGSEDFGFSNFIWLGRDVETCFK